MSQGYASAGIPLAPEWVTTWSPSYANLTVGDGVVITRHIIDGNVVHVKFQFTLGGTSSIGTRPTISPPIAAELSGYGGDNNSVGTGVLLDDGNQRHPCLVVITSAGDFMPVSYSEAACTPIVDIGSASPFTWATNVKISFTATYEPA